MSRAPALGGGFWGRSLVEVEWRKLCFVTYLVDPALLSTRLPVGLSLETWHQQALVSLVFYQAHYPSVLGFVPSPELSSTELALRYLVREGPRRGVVSVQEASSSAAVALAERSFFHEPTRHASLRAEEELGAQALSLRYEIDDGGRCYSLRVLSRLEPVPPERETLDDLVCERPFAYSRTSGGEFLRYDLDHPRWATYAVVEHQLDVDFGALYGDEWRFLNTCAPEAVTVSEGSRVRASLPA